MGTISRKIRIKKKYQKSKTATEMKNAFGKLNHRLCMAEERINKLEDRSVGTSQAEMRK